MTEMKSTIVIFSCFYEPFMSGAELAVKNVVERLASRYNFIILTARLQIRNPKSEIRNINGNQFIIRRIGLGLPLDKYLYAFWAPWVARTLNPKIVHGVMESYAGIALWLYKIFGGRAKTVLTLQSGDLDMLEKQAKLTKWPLGFVWKKIHTSPHQVVAIGSSLKKRAEGLGAKNVLIIPNQADLEGVSGYPRADNRHNQIICVARLSEEKGHRYLLEAMRKVAEIVRGAKLILIGDGELRNDLEEMARRLNIDVVFKGKLTHRDALNEIAASDVFVLPSLGEGMGIVIAEAQALGVPVVATNVGGIPDLIMDGVTGFLVPPKDSEALAGALVKALQMNNAERQKITQNAYNNRANYDPAVIADRYRELYDKMSS
jgi:glycosyltransferase involved in cell wall biosynthesis